MTLALMENFANLISAKENQPQASFSGLNTLADSLVGARLFTLTAVDFQRQEATRIFSNMPEAYPRQGTKPILSDAWSERVLKRSETFVANTIDTIAKVFFDHELIRSLGCESVLNIPVSVAGQVIGTINCLHVSGHYTPERVRLARHLRLPGAAAFLLQQSDLIPGDH